MTGPQSRARRPAAGELMGIHEAASTLGVTMRTLRFYEDKGLIAPLRVGSKRIYSRRELGRMQLIQRGKRLGFSIREISEFLDLYDLDPGHREQQRKLLDQVSRRIDTLRTQADAIELTLAELRAIESQTRAALAASPGEAR